MTSLALVQESWRFLELDALMALDNDFARQAWLYVVCGDWQHALAWAADGRRAARNYRESGMLMLVSGMAYLGAGDPVRAARFLRYASEGLRFADPARAGIALICLALVSPAESVKALSQAEDRLEDAMRIYAPRGDFKKWRATRDLKERVVCGLEALLPPRVVMEYKDTPSY